MVKCLKKSPDLVRSGRTCPANLGVRSCPVRKLICPVRSSPNFGNTYKKSTVWSVNDGFSAKPDGFPDFLLIKIFGENKNPETRRKPATAVFRMIHH